MVETVSHSAAGTRIHCLTDGLEHQSEDIAGPRLAAITELVETNLLEIRLIDVLRWYPRAAQYECREIAV